MVSLNVIVFKTYVSKLPAKGIIDMDTIVYANINTSFTNFGSLNTCIF